MGMCVSVASATPAAATAKNRNTVVMDTPEEAGEEADGMMVCGCVFFGLNCSITFPDRFLKSDDAIKRLTAQSQLFMTAALMHAQSLAC